VAEGTASKKVHSWRSPGRICSFLKGVRKELEFRIAEAGSGTTRTTGQIPLPDLENTHAQFSHIHFSTA